MNAFDLKVAFDVQEKEKLNSSMLNLYVEIENPVICKG